MENNNKILAFPDKNVLSDFSSLTGGHVAIRTTQYYKIIEWYREKLDFRLVHEWTNGDMKLAFIAPPSDDSFIIEVLGVNNADNINTAKVHQGYDHVCFNVTSLDTVTRALQNRNITILRSFTVTEIGKRVAFIADPCGNLIEFCENTGQAAVKQ